MLKKIIVILILILGLSVYAANNTSGQLTKLENVTFGIDYPKEKIDNRIVRLEKYIYGKSKSGNIDQRLKNLNKDIAGDVIGEEIKPSYDTFLSEEDYVVKDESENYPIINEIEQKLFFTPMPERDLKYRITNIEKKMFNETYDKEDYFSRMERIKDKYFAENPTTANNPSYSNYTATQIPSFYEHPSKRWEDVTDYTTYSPKDEYELSLLEQKIFKNTYPNDSFKERLSRLENKVFETDYFYDDDKIRLDRLSSVGKHGKISKRFNGRKFQTGLNTTISIGTLVLMILAIIL